MPILRLAYSTQFLIALIAVFVLWSQVGGQSHLDLLPWTVKLGLGLAAAYGMVRATAASVSGDRAWNGQTRPLAGFHAGGAGRLRLRLVLRAHESGRSDEADPQQDTTISRLHSPSELLHSCRNATVGSTRVARLAGT